MGGQMAQNLDCWMMVMMVVVMMKVRLFQYDWSSKYRISSILIVSHFNIVCG
jgi:hypothetical protein